MKRTMRVHGPLRTRQWLVVIISICNNLIMLFLQQKNEIFFFMITISEDEYTNSMTGLRIATFTGGLLKMYY